MKKNIFMKSIVGLTFICLVLMGCKKGDEDPFFSLLSRKNRICGEWDLKAVNSSSSSTDDNGYVSTSSIIYEGGDIIESFEDDYQTSLTKKTIDKYTLNIKKDGTWTLHQTYNVHRTQTVFNTTEILTYHTDRFESGNWAFINKTKGEYENKERVIFYLLESSSNTESTTIVTMSPSDTTTEELGSYKSEVVNSIGEISFTYDLLMLKSKEMKWISANNKSFISTSSNNGTSETEVYNYTDNESIIWVAE